MKARRPAGRMYATVHPNSSRLEARNTRALVPRALPGEGGREEGEEEVGRRGKRRKGGREKERRD